MTTPTNATLDAVKVVRETIEELTTIARGLREANATLDRIARGLRDEKAEHGAKTAGRKKRRIEAGENRLRDHFGADDLE